MGPFTVIWRDLDEHIDVYILIGPWYRKHAVPIAVPFSATPEYDNMRSSAVMARDDLLQANSQWSPYYCDQRSPSNLQALICHYVERAHTVPVSGANNADKDLRYDRCPETTSTRERCSRLPPAPSAWQTKHLPSGESRCRNRGASLLQYASGWAPGSLTA